MRTAIYPGTFDPITYGHIDIAKRASCIFSKVVAVVAENPSKHPMFSIEERLEMVSDAFKETPNIDVISYSGLIVNCLKEVNGSAIIRGLRALSDFEYEFQMGLTNRKLMPTAETVFFMPSSEYIYLSSTMVKQIARLNGDITDFVPEHVKNYLKRNISEM